MIEVAQQSRIRHKEDFVIAFSPIVAEATSIAYKGAPAELQAKLRRVVDVWKDRTIFEAPIQAAIDARLNGTYISGIWARRMLTRRIELDKARGTAKPGFGGSPFASSSSSTPSEFAPLISAHQKIAKLTIPLKATVSNANLDYQKQTDTSTAPPSAPVYAARLNGLLKTLANAESAVAECVKAREGLISGLEKLLDANRSALATDKETVSELGRRKGEIEDKKQQVEVAIMRALGPSESNGESGEGGSASPAPEPDRPEMEELTPEMEAFTPPEMESEPMETLDISASAPAAGVETVAPSYQSLPISTNGSNKRRRVEESGDFPDLGGDDGIDADVAEMLKDGQS